MSAPRSTVVGGSAVAAAMLVASVVGLLAWSLRPGPPPEWSADSPSLAIDRVVEDAQAIVAVEPVILQDLSLDAEAAVAGYALALGVQHRDTWTIDLTSLGGGAGAVADRASHGLLERGVAFERTGEDWAVLQGPGLLPVARSEDDPAVVLAAVVEVAGSPEGALLVDDASESAHQLETRSAVLGLARSVGLEPIVDGVGVFLPQREDRRLVAGLGYVCRMRVPLSSGAPCAVPPRDLASIDVDSLDDWTVGITGSLVPGAPQVPASADGGVGWTNAEAQRYVADGVEAGPDGLRLTASPVGGASVDELPYTSGLVVLDETLGLGVLEVDVVVPAGDGLWPAVWLLDAEACEMPGRCPAYASGAYHEIDVLETNGATPDLAFTSLHWWDDQLRSASASTELPGLSDGSVHTVRLERRPGLLRWLIDGEERYVIAGPVDATIGPHRTAPMRLILNLAVGGRFAGELQIGRYGQWWGDARVPASFPDVGWDTAVLEIRGVRVSTG